MSANPSPDESAKSNTREQQPDTTPVTDRTRLVYSLVEAPRTEVQTALAESAREQARRKKWKDIVRRTLIFLSILLICVGICGGILFKAVMDWDAEMRKPVTYTMPAAAQIIDQYASPMDFFGDFEYCAAFRVSDTEYDSLLRNGFNWIYIGQGSTTPTPNVPHWKDGRLPDYNLSIGECFNRLTAKPNSATYHYLLDEGVDWEYLLAIDEKEKIIFYYRVTV